MGAIDFHTHAFPDALAGRAVRHLEQTGNIKARLNGTVSDLLRSMDAAGVEASVVASIATKPGQFRSIADWSRSIASERIVPFPSIHPADPEAVSRVRELAESGFRGLKMHPYYQDFAIDEPRMFPIYETVRESGLILLMHTGFDMAFPRVRIADPVRIVRVAERFPGLLFVASHLGAWDDWDEVRRRFLGRPIYTDISFAAPYLSSDELRAFIEAHPREYLLFGTDSPWADPAELLARIRALDLPSETEYALLEGNARRLLDLESTTPNAIHT